MTHSGKGKEARVGYSNSDEERNRRLDQQAETLGKIGQALDRQGQALDRQGQVLAELLRRSA